MDREAIQVSVRYQELSEQHFNGGYFSDSVKAQGEQFKELSEEEKKAFFADTFNAVWATARQVQADPRFSGETIDLSEQGLGTVTVDLFEYQYPAEDDSPTYRSVMVASDAFDPTPVRESVWINAPGDDLGLETAGRTMVQLDQEPDNWRESIYANPDGSFNNGSYFGNLDIDTEIMRLLDAKETLGLVTETLGL